METQIFSFATATSVEEILTLENKQLQQDLQVQKLENSNLKS